MKNERKANCKVQTIFDEVYFTPTVLDLSFTALKILFYHVSGTSTLDDFFGIPSQEVKFLSTNNICRILSRSLFKL